MRLATMLALLILLPAPAFAMGWYDPICCSNRDCELLPIEAIYETREGWQISYCSGTRPNTCISGFVKHGTERMSQDGSFHLCFNTSRIICFYAPVSV